MLPETVKFIAPSFPPLHLTFTTIEVITKGVGSFIVTAAVFVQPYASVTVTLYEPATSPEGSSTSAALSQLKE